ncbi:MAG: calcium-binding protein, partial [Pseudomonadota bacterium]
MSVITAGSGPVYMLDPIDLADLLDAITTGSPNASSFSFANGSFGWTFQGSGFSGYSGGLPSNGTVTGVAFSIGATNIITISGASVTMSELINDLATGDPTALLFSFFGGADQITGSAQDDLLLGLTGNDSISAGLGSDFLDGGACNDTLAGGSGDDQIFSLEGVDSLDGGAGVDELGLDRSTSNATFNVVASAWLGVAGATLADGTVVKNFELLNLATGSGNDTLTIDTALTSVIGFNAGAGTDRVVVDLSATSVAIGLNETVPNIFHLTQGAADATLTSIESFVVTGGSGADTLHGGTSDDTLNGGGGDDQIFSVSGADSLDGGAGVDRLGLDRSASNATFNIASSAVLGAGGTLTDGTVVKNFESLNLTTGAADDTLTLDTSLSSVLSFNGGAGTDRLIADFSGSAQAVIMSGITPSLFSMALGAAATQLQNVESFVITGSSGADSLLGGTSGDTLSSGAGADLISSGDGNDALSGGADNDTLDGGLGVNLIAGDDGADRISTFGIGDTVDGGAGNDVLAFDHSSASAAITLTSAALASGADDLIGDGSVLRSIEGLAGIKTGTGNDFVDLIGAVGAGFSSPVTSYDTGAGDDEVRLTAPSGYFVYSAGSGVDRLWLDLSAATHEVDILSGSSVTIQVGVDPINLDLSFSTTGVEHFSVLAGSAADYLIGGDGDDSLSGGGGNDIIRGGGGQNTLLGGDGNDQVTSTGVDVINGGVGTDLLWMDRTAINTNQTFDTSTLAANSFELFYWLTGAGDDTLTYVYSSASIGESRFYAGNGADRLVADFSATNADVQASSSNIWVNFGVTTVLLSSVETVSLTGGGGNDSLSGGAGADYLNGGAGDDQLGTLSGADTMIGGSGNDHISFFPGGPPVYADGGAGTDYLLYADFSTSTPVTFATSELASDAGITLSTGTFKSFESFDIRTGSGNDTITIDTIAPTQQPNHFDAADGQDTLILNYANQDVTIFTDQYDAFVTTAEHETLFSLNFGNFETLKVFAGTGADALTGGAETDLFSGGAGNDTFDPRKGVDTIDGGAGVDTVTYFNSISNGVQIDLTTGVAHGGDAEGDTLTNIENVIGSYLGADSLVGGAGANYFTGNDGDDTLNGGAGADTLDGGGGSDTYYVDDGGDVILDFYYAQDVVHASVSYSIHETTVRTLDLTGAALNGQGNILANVLIGNANNNLLDGDMGADSMTGGVGDDTYVVDDVGDVVTENAAQGVDTVRSTLSYTLGANLENLTIIGIGGLSGTGNNLNNVMTGNGGGNTLDGKVGADTLVGGLGNDIYVIDNVGDVVTENASE